jgi:hypothetical protein
VGPPITSVKTNRHIFRVKRRDINYLRVTIESYDGMGVVRTVDPQAALVEVQVAPGCEKLFSHLVGSLAEDEDIKLIEETGDSVESIAPPARRPRPGSRVSTRSGRARTRTSGAGL